MKTLFKILVGVYIGVLLKQRYRVPRVMTPEEMWDRVKEAERQQRVETEEDGGDESRSRRRRGYWYHHQHHSGDKRSSPVMSEAEKTKVDDTLKDIVDRLKNLEKMFRKEPDVAAQPQ